MKRLLLFIPITFIFSLTAFSQMVTTDPAVPVTGQQISIYYDSSIDDGELHNYTGDLYVHTGLTINGTSWQNVIGTWGSNSTQPKLTYLGNYQYELVISPDIETYYSLDEGDIVTKICLVFRSPDASKQTRPDIFIDVFEPGLNATFILPEKFSIVAELNDKIPLKASATMADSVTLYINDEFIKTGSSPDLVTDNIL